MIGKLRKRLRHDEKGFTLIELLVVVIILGILTAIAVPSYLSFRGRSEDAADKSNVRSVIPSIESYFADHSTYVGSSPALLQGHLRPGSRPSKYILVKLSCRHGLLRPAPRPPARTSGTSTPGYADRDGRLPVSRELELGIERARETAPFLFSQADGPACRRDKPMSRVRAPWLVAIVGASFLAPDGGRPGCARRRPCSRTSTSTRRSAARSQTPAGRRSAADPPISRPSSQPILTAPAWLIGDVETAYRIVQAIGALAMSLAAFPSTCSPAGSDCRSDLPRARRARRSRARSASMRPSSRPRPFAYPLVLAAVAAAVSALARPSRRTQLAFVGFAGLATFARIQFVVLPLVFVLGAPRGRRPRTARQGRGSRAGASACALRRSARGRARRRGSALVGYYHASSAPPRAAGDAELDGLGRDGGRLRGRLDHRTRSAARALADVRPPRATATSSRSRGRRVPRRRPAPSRQGCYQADPASLQGSLGVNGIKERYLFYLVPLIGICFALYARRGWPLRLPHLAACRRTVRRLGSRAAERLRRQRRRSTARRSSTASTGSPASSARHVGRLAAVAVAAGLILAVAVLALPTTAPGHAARAGARPARDGAASAGAVAFDITTTARPSGPTCRDDPSWIDHAPSATSRCSSARAASRSASLQQLFWNRSIDARRSSYPTRTRFDSFRTLRARVGGRRLAVVAAGLLIRTRSPSTATARRFG